MRVSHTMKYPLAVSTLVVCAIMWGCGGGGGSGEPDLQDDSDTGSALGVPTNVAAMPGDEEITLRWDGVAEATHYNVYRATESGVSAENYTRLTDGVVERITATTTRVLNLENGKTYYFVVTAADGTREGAGSIEVQAAPSATAMPTAPRNLIAAAGPGEVVLSWDNVPEATSYNLYLASEAGVTPANYTALADGARLTRLANPVRVTNLNNGALYYFAVTAVNAAGESGISNPAQAAPLAPASSNANLAGLILSGGSLTPMFDPAVTAYDSDVLFATNNIAVTPTSEDTAATLAVNGTAVVSGLPTNPLPLGEGTNVISVTVTAADGTTTRTYSVTVTRPAAGNFAQQALIKASNSDPGDEFAYAVALSGDTLVIGAPFEASTDTNQTDDSAPGAGAVYVFVRSGDTWSQQAYIKASNAGASDEFGHSVALSGDTLAVGARNEASAVTGSNGNQLNNSAAGAGAVYVFVRSNDAWIQQAYIKASNTGAADQFGTSVALAGDTLAVGAPREDSATNTINGEQLNETALNAGAVYVFIRDGLANWSQQAYVKASNADADDRFGYRVALSSDTLAVSAYNEDSASIGIDGDQTDDMARDAGAAYVFVRNDTGEWSQQAYIKASNTGPDDHFGSSLALDSDT
ncbi:MAG: cadherin-like beta sandwich domain-containing protein, partial [Gammaproteobacteria bacterium]|nr:cadherin-like beta sandwich domain-containing protein [Gammaproteobacteria bacterium]